MSGPYEILDVKTYTGSTGAHYKKFHDTYLELAADIDKTVLDDLTRIAGSDPKQSAKHDAPTPQAEKSDPNRDALVSGLGDDLASSMLLHQQDLKRDKETIAQLKKDLAESKETHSEVKKTRVVKLIPMNPRAIEAAGHQVKDYTFELDEGRFEHVIVVQMPQNGTQKDDLAFGSAVDKIGKEMKTLLGKKVLTVMVAPGFEFQLLEVG